MPRLHVIHVARIQVVSILVSLVAVVSCIGHKIVVTATCIHLYPRVEHCLELIFVYMSSGILVSGYMFLM